MLNAIPLIGWLVSLFFSASLAVPFWFIWTVCGIGRTFFGWLPGQYVGVGFWQTVGLFIVVSILKAVLLPQFASQTNVGGK